MDVIPSIVNEEKMIDMTESERIAYLKGHGDGYWRGIEDAVATHTFKTDTNRA